MAEAKNTILIGIAGGTGSGKTTLADKVVDSFGRDEVSILRHDNYYKRHDEMNYEDRSKLNYDPSGTCTGHCIRGYFDLCRAESL